MKEHGITTKDIYEILGCAKHDHTKAHGGVTPTATVDQRRGSLGAGVFSRADLSTETQNSLDKLGIESLSHLFFGSVSASSTDLDSWYSKKLRQFLRFAKKYEGTERFSTFVESGFEEMRGWIAEQYKIESSQILFSRSGTDAISLLQTLFPNAARVLTAESGSTMAKAYKGKHVCNMDLQGQATPLGEPVIDGYLPNTTLIPLRERKHGVIRETSEIHEDIILAIAMAQQAGNSDVIVHLPFPPKTGLLKDRGETIDFAKTLKDKEKLKRYFHDKGIWVSDKELPNIIIVGDFAQTRDELCHPDNNQELMSLFDVVLMTSSKSLGGAPFGGVTLMSKQIRDRLKDALGDPAWIRYFQPYFEHYLARGHLSHSMIEGNSFINGLPVDTALFGRLLSASPLAKKASQMHPQHLLENAIRHIRGKITTEFAEEKHLTVVGGHEYPFSIENVITIDEIHATETVLNLRIHGIDATETRKLMRTELVDKNIPEGNPLGHIIRLPFELGNVVAEESLNHDGKHDQILRIAISLQHCVDWDDRELQNSIKASIEAMVTKLHYVVNMQKRRRGGANKSG